MSILKSFHVLDSGLVQKSLERFAFTPQDEFWRNVAGDACVAVFGITPAGGGGAGEVGSEGGWFDMEGRGVCCWSLEVGGCESLELDVVGDEEI